VGQPAACRWLRFDVKQWSGQKPYEWQRSL
jgi:hypothetical protein